jgi:preprotein translocase subunit SecE
MDSKTGSALDTAKMVLAVSLLVSGVAGFYYFSEKLLVYRVLGILVVSAIALVAVLSTAVGRNLQSFLQESRVEVRKMVWPTKQETVQATMVVVALVFLMGIMLWLLDMFLFWGIGKLTGVGS